MYRTCKSFVERIANIGTDENYDSLENRKIRISNAIAYFGICTFTFYLVTFSSIAPIFIGMNGLGIVILALVIFLNYKRKHFLARLWICIDVSSLTVLFAYVFGETSLAEYFLFACSILPLFFFEKPKQYVPLFLFVVGCYVACLLVFEYTEPCAKALMDSWLGRPLSLLNIFTIFILQFMMIRFFKQEQLTYVEMIEHQKDELVQQKEEILMQNEEIITQSEELTSGKKALEISLEQIQHKNKEITSSINYARRIQGAILPLEKEMSENFTNFFLFFRPRDIVSGDFYWFTEKNNRKIIAVADCTGHGVPGAFMSMVGSSLLDKIVKDEQVTETGQILTNLHLAIRLALKQANSESRDGMDMSICAIDEQQQILYFSGAKNPLYFVQDNKMNVIKGDKFPIGGHQRENQRIFTTHKISMEQKTLFYLFSDGYQDQFGGTENRKFMTKRFRNLLFEHHTKSFSEQKQILETTLDDWTKTGQTKQTDDILVVGFQV